MEMAVDLSVSLLADCNVGVNMSQRAFTCKERSVLRGSFTDTGVYGFGDQRVDPEGVLMQTCAFEDLYYVAPSGPSSIKFRETEPVVTHKPVCH
eukprot:superscaffoldBa00001981_g12737